jgi:ABC-type nitrate/sulfonate/bicarbonate transport system substrate-binding protein
MSCDDRGWRFLSSFVEKKRRAGRSCRKFARRSFLAGVSAVALAQPARVTAAPLGRRAKVRVGWSGAICEAATYVAYENGFFVREGLDVELVRLSDPLAATHAIGSGAIDALSAPRSN